jgi:proteasome lid subunit RPN8/RPN11
MQDHKLCIVKTMWQKLMAELNKRGGGGRETGAFLLGKKGSRVVTEYICYDDLDPHALDTGIIVFNGDGYIPLWELCLQHGLKVLADVHTHPCDWTGQSGLDMRHPMIAQAGHIALIVPCYATKKRQLLKGVGIHEFLGNAEWEHWAEHNGVVRLIK